MTAFVTFRLADSLPSEVVRAYAEERRILERRIAQEGFGEELRRDARLLFGRRIEAALDAGIGTCRLAEPGVGSMVLGALRFFDGQRYALHAAAVMPNHVHVVATLAPGEGLAGVTHAWKSWTANQAQRRFGHVGSLWQEESYDHVVRDEGELERVVRYTLRNPEKAGLREWPHVYAGPGGEGE